MASEVGSHKEKKWTSEEDRMLKEYLVEHGEGKWASVAHNSGLQRSANDCRKRWMNHLRPEVNHAEFTEEERETITRLHSKMGNRWSKIAKMLQGRTDDQIKSYCRMMD
ncbi:transcription factor MYB57-like [Tripterygium wilfordii]|uniref:transcription factor MYB57-like n=1 Tax=Tripterygium wilfordii TaxID=458696 RepID=UPI0018F83805|nr:transcription factor MYB57-like [Tripterygium wilfordii]